MSTSDIGDTNIGDTTNSAAREWKILELKYYPDDAHQSVPVGVGGAGLECPNPNCKARFVQSAAHLARYNNKWMECDRCHVYAMLQWTLHLTTATVTEVLLNAEKERTASLSKQLTAVLADREAQNRAYQILQTHTTGVQSEHQATKASRDRWTDAYYQLIPTLNEVQRQLNAVTLEKNAALMYVETCKQLIENIGVARHTFLSHMVSDIIQMWQNQRTTICKRFDNIVNANPNRHDRIDY